MTERRIHLVTIALVLATSAGCKRDEQQRRAAGAKELPPLVASSATMSLPVSGFGDAVVAPPAGAAREMPVLVAVLGIGDTCQWRDECDRQVE